MVALLIKNLPAVLNPWVGKMPWRREWQSTPVFLPGEFHGQEWKSLQRSLVDYSPWGRKESNMTDLLKTWSRVVSAEKGMKKKEKEKENEEDVIYI